MSDTASRSLECHSILTTSAAPGAIAVIQLQGRDCAKILSQLTGVQHWPIGQLRLVRFRDIDEGLAGCITHDVAQIMPHGGPRVVQRMLQQIREFGVIPCGHDFNASELFPEARDRYESLMLETLARASSPLAIELLLTQPVLWRDNAPLLTSDRVRSTRLNCLLSPPTVVLVGSPNVGKSTLSNALLGRCMSIALDLPGTTRDYTIAQIELEGLVVHWHDTPGIRRTDDPIESKAIEMANDLITQADLVIAMTDAQHDWPQLPRRADLRIANKSDIAVREDADLCISAATGEGLARLVRLIRDTLLPPEDMQAATERPWLFDERLLERMTHAAGEDVP